MHWTDFKDIPPARLALHLAGRTDLDTAYIVRQVEGWQRLRTKVPSWAAIRELAYPPRLSLEQCSSEAAAQYKEALVARLIGAPTGGVWGQRMADLTGGLGVDFARLAAHYDEAYYIEQSEVLCDLARHNLPLLGLPHAHVCPGDAVEALAGLPPLDLLYLDPARRDDAGRKTVRISDCHPDVSVLWPDLLRQAPLVLVKLSPMLDITGALRELGGHVAEVHAVSAAGECKELLLVLTRDVTSDPLLVASEPQGTLSLRRSDESDAVPTGAEPLLAPLLASETTMPADSSITDSPHRVAHLASGTTLSTDSPLYLYEPGPSVMKVGAFKWVAVHYGLAKVGPDAHLYVGNVRRDDFPGRCFRLTVCYTFRKEDLRRLHADTAGRANLSVRGFPGTVQALRQKLKLRDGGDHYLFATTLGQGQHIILAGKKGE